MALVRRYARTKMELEAKAVSRRQTFVRFALLLGGAIFAYKALGR